MKNILTTTFKTILVGTAAAAMSAFVCTAQTHVETSLRFTSDNGSFSDITFGIDERATDTLDTALGEKLYPNIPLPPGVFNIYLRFSDQIGEIWSPKDFRPTPPQRYIHKTFRIILPSYSNRGAYPYTISWENLDPRIDSARVRDIETGTVINFSLKGKNSERIQSDVPGIGKDIIERLEVDVWYNIATNGVEDTEHTTALVSPNPGRDLVTVTTTGYCKSYELLSMTGETVRRESISDGIIRIDMNNLAQGIYIFRGITTDGSIETAKIIRQ